MGKVDSQVKVGSLELRAHCSRVLERAGIKTVADLQQRTAAELLSVPGIARKRLRTILAVLADRGIVLEVGDGAPYWLRQLMQRDYGKT